MTLVMYVVVTALVATGLFFGIRYFVRAYAQYRDSRLIICPENGETAMVEVDAAHAALTSVLGSPDIRLQNCWRWPVHEGCHQECLLQLDVAPAECLARGVLMRWYEFKSCHYCRRPFEQVHLLDHKPALLSPEGHLADWNEAAMNDLEVVLATYKPVCWDCYIAQSFVRDHGELVVYRPWQEGIHRSACRRSTRVITRMGAALKFSSSVRTLTKEGGVSNDNRKFYDTNQKLHHGAIPPFS